MNSQPSYYNLVATVGSSPAVVTEIIWYYAMDLDAPRHPAEVTILTTNHGRRAWRSRVMEAPAGGGPSPWERLCEEVLEGHTPAVRVLRPRHGAGDDNERGAERDFLDDITNAFEDERSANLCYETVHRLTQLGQLPLVGSIAGGRKTMSAHLMAAFTAYARRDDELVHVLVPEEDEKNPDYFFPARDVDRIESGIQCIQIPFPMLRPYFRRGLFRELPADRRDLRALMDALKPYDFADPHVATPAAVLYIGRGPAGSNLVRFPNPDGEDQGSCQLSTQNVATLLTLAEPFARAAGPAAVAALLDDAARARYTFCTSLNPTRPAYRTWRNATMLSQAISRLNDQLQQAPVAAAYLSVRKVDGRPAYYWAHGRPVALRVLADASFLERARRWNDHFERLRLEPAGG